MLAVFPRDCCRLGQRDFGGLDRVHQSHCHRHRPEAARHGCDLGSTAGDAFKVAAFISTTSAASSSVRRSFRPARPMRLLNHAGVEVAGRNAVVVGASNVVGKPMALMLMQRDAKASLPCQSVRPSAIHHPRRHPCRRRRLSQLDRWTDGQNRCLCHSAASLLVRCDLALASDCARNLGFIDDFRRHGGPRRKIAQSGNGRSIPDSGNRSCAHHAEGPVPVVSWQRQKWQRAMRGET